MLLASLGDYLSVDSVRKDRLKRTILLQLSDLVSADRDDCSHGFIISPSSSLRGCSEGANRDALRSRRGSPKPDVKRFGSRNSFRTPRDGQRLKKTWPS